VTLKALNARFYSSTLWWEGRMNRINHDISIDASNATHV
jgi:hypothetical protein